MKGFQAYSFIPAKAGNPCPVLICLSAKITAYHLVLYYFIFHKYPFIFVD